MKDPYDNKTENLFPSSGARRQAAFKARRKAEGYKRATVWIHEASWQAGYDAALAGQPSTPHSADVDGLSWFSGYIEGQAKRQEGESA